MTTVAMLEAKLRESAAKDRSKKSRCSQRDDGTITVQISGTTSGLMLALAEATGESDATILERLDAWANA